jgi:TetR/AcrR family transcriptional repressor of nem operon
MSKAEVTRSTILHKAFELIYRQGYQATSVDVIIATTQVTKGAFYYHFKNKDEMGLAMIQEVMYPGLYNALVQPLLEAQYPAREIYTMMHEILLNNSFFDVKYGCPAINLIEEMAPLNEAFRTALSGLMIQWQQSIQKSILKGKETGSIRQEADPEQVACFVLAGYSGIRNIGKILGVSCYHVYLKSLQSYLSGLA